MNLVAGKTPAHNRKAEVALLREALGAFDAATGAVAKLVTLEPRVVGGGVADAAVEVKRGRHTGRYLAEIKGALPATALGHVAAKLQQYKQPAMLVTRYVTPPMAERLKALNLAFMDTAGNAYINTPHFYIYVTGRKPPPVEEPARQVKAFRPTGLQVIFALLCRPELVRAPYREIAEAANVALGTVGWVMYDLKRLNYLVERGRHGRQLAQAHKLLDAWVTAYAQQLRPKLYLGRFRAPAADWWKGVDWRALHAVLGGEPAAAELTGYLKPEITTVYTAGDLDDLLIQHRLKKDPDGDVEILKTFWRFGYQWDYPQLAPPLLIYADLLATAADRNIETGKLIYERYLARRVGKD